VESSFRAKIRVKIAGRPAEQKNSTKFTPRAKIIKPPIIAKVSGEATIFLALSFNFNPRSIFELIPRILQTPG